MTVGFEAEVYAIRESRTRVELPIPSLQLLAALPASLVSYGVLTLRISHNEFHRRTSFSHPFCLELLFVAPIIL